MTDPHSPSSAESGVENTDREIWRGPDEGGGDFYADSLHLTKEGALGINCGGRVYVKPIREWHRLARRPEADVEELAREELAIARLRAAVTGEEFEWEIDGGSPFDDVQFLLAAYDRLITAPAQPTGLRECLQSIADADDSEPREPDDADWRFRFLEAQRAARCALASQPSPAATVGTGDFYLVPREIIDQFPEININNYDHDDACALNAWGCEVVTNANPAPAQCSAGSEAVDPVRRAFRNADAQDWEHLSSLLGYGGHGKFWRHVFEEVREHLLHIQPQAAPLTDILASCKGEHSKFEEWAAAEKYDMQEHPIHYLFTDPKTYAARQGWKAALRYVSSSLTRPQFARGEDAGDALARCCEELIAALEGLRPLPLALDGMAEGIIAKAQRALSRSHKESK